MRTFIPLALLVLIGGTSAHGAGSDILVADFEADTYGDWIVEGEAFGPGPAKGTLAGQMHVSGFQGKRLVNSFYEGDGTTGKLTSPPLRIERDYLTFLIGGGAHEGATCMQLLLDGQIVRTAVGPNTAPGGSEGLVPQVWDVQELKGKTVTIQIVDAATGGWGHVNIDHIVLTDERPQVPDYQPLERTFTVDKKFLVIPIQNGAKPTELILEVDGRAVRRYRTELSTDPDKVDWYAFLTIESYRGKSARITVARATDEGFALVQQADQVPGSDTWYSESLRPQFHFSQKVGWNNDPNGMVHYDGEWHLFLQHNPVGWKWGNMTWGHAVSTDLVHWEQLPNALFPKTMAQGDCFSGSAIVDKRNTGGFKTGEEDVIVAFLTDTGAGEALAYSNDRGRTFTWYADNPVVKHKGRDPKVIWYAYGENDKPLNAKASALGGHWVMVVYDEHEEFGRNAAFYTSTNLKEWDEQSHLPGYFECTELFKLPVDEDGDQNRWVVFAADAQYAVGLFDGRVFTPEHTGKHRVHYGSYYASQTFSNSPDGRKIQIGWAQIAMPGMPFNQTFSFPHQLTLRTTEEGIRMFAEPVEEIESLYGKRHTITNKRLDGADSSKIAVAGERFDIRATFELGDANQVGLDLGGERIVYDTKTHRLHDASMKPVDGKVTIRVLVDRPMLEIIGNRGQVFITKPRDRKGQLSSIEAFAEGGLAKLLELEANELRSIWKK